MQHIIEADSTPRLEDEFMLAVEKTLLLPPASPNAVNTNAVSDSGCGSKDEVTLIIGREYLTIQVAKNQEVMLGRAHSSNTAQPLVDLTKYGAALQGASRLHATIRHDDKGWWIKDNSSSNGTWINGERIAPHVPVRLEGVSQVWLAKLDVRVVLPPVNPS
jgi:pSer/pThr/pTyr-binding forkhead associated (FHA) protein